MLEEAPPQAHDTSLRFFTTPSPHLFTGKMNIFTFNVELFHKTNPNSRDTNDFSFDNAKEPSSSSNEKLNITPMLLNCVKKHTSAAVVVGIVALSFGVIRSSIRQFKRRRGSPEPMGKSQSPSDERVKEPKDEKKQISDERSPTSTNRVSAQEGDSKVPTAIVTSSKNINFKKALDTKECEIYSSQSTYLDKTRSHVMKRATLHVRDQQESCCYQTCQVDGGRHAQNDRLQPGNRMERKSVHNEALSTELVAQPKSTREMSTQTDSLDNSNLVVEANTRKESGTQTNTSNRKKKRDSEENIRRNNAVTRNTRRGAKNDSRNKLGNLKKASGNKFVSCAPPQVHGKVDTPEDYFKKSWLFNNNIAPPTFNEWISDFNHFLQGSATSERRVDSQEDYLKNSWLFNNNVAPPTFRSGSRISTTFCWADDPMLLQCFRMQGSNSNLIFTRLTWKKKADLPRRRKRYQHRTFRSAVHK